MKSAFGAVAATVAVLAVLIGLGWIFTENDYQQTKHYAPKYEVVRRQTFEQSKAYNQGMVQELQNMQFQYEQADKEHKAALASIILHRAADYDQNQLPPDLYDFVEKLKRQQDTGR